MATYRQSRAGGWCDAADVSGEETRLRRRDVIALLGGAAAALPRATLAQQGERIRRVGVLINVAADDSEIQASLVAFKQELERLGWFEGRNAKFDTRFTNGSLDQQQVIAKELVALQPDVILVHATPAIAAVQKQTRTIPIVFVNASDPVGSGFVASLARPGGNLTGLQMYEASIVGKWLSMLKEIAPNTTRIAFISNPKITTYFYFLRAAQALAPSLDVELVPSPAETPAEIKGVIYSFSRTANGALFFPPNTTSTSHRDLIIPLAAQLRLPAVYAFRFFTAAGGLMSYGIDQVDLFRRATGYVDRILRGEKPADLPVQAPTKFETVINLKAAKALGLTVPPGLLVGADEVIE
jgi:putative tryptophan/tyrosine transport system substrate-binding protein